MPKFVYNIQISGKGRTNKEAFRNALKQLEKNKPEAPELREMDDFQGQTEDLTNYGISGYQESNN